MSTRMLRRCELCQTAQPLGHFSSGDFQCVNCVSHSAGSTPVLRSPRCVYGTTVMSPSLSLPLAGRPATPTVMALSPLATYGVPPAQSPAALRRAVLPSPPPGQAYDGALLSPIPFRKCTVCQEVRKMGDFARPDEYVCNTCRGGYAGGWGETTSVAPAPSQVGMWAVPQQTTAMYNQLPLDTLPAIPAAPYPAEPASSVGAWPVPSPRDPPQSQANASSIPDEPTAAVHFMEEETELSDIPIREHATVEHADEELAPEEPEAPHQEVPEPPALEPPLPEVAPAAVKSVLHTGSRSGSTDDHLFFSPPKRVVVQGWSVDRERHLAAIGALEEEQQALQDSIDRQLEELADFLQR